MAYIFAIHVPIAGLSLVPVVLGWPLVLLPVHIVFLELIIDPACSIIFEAEPDETDVMRGRRAIPRSRCSAGGWSARAAQGGSVLRDRAAGIRRGAEPGWGEAEARALTFTTLVVANLGLIFANRSWSRLILATLVSRNPAVWWVSGLALGVLGLVLYVPFLQRLFRFMPLDAREARDVSRRWPRQHHVVRDPQSCSTGGDASDGFPLPATPDRHQHRPQS